jgi:hypothetical protein
MVRWYKQPLRKAMRGCVAELLGENLFNNAWH